MFESQINQNFNLSMPDPQFDRILSVLKQIVGKAMGVSASEIDDRANFLELGFESIQLLQITGAIKKQFGINLSLRLLIENSSTIKDLAIYLTRQIPPTEQILVDSTQEESQLLSPSNPNPTTNQNVDLLPADNTAIKRIIAQQLQVMSKQLDLLSESISKKQKLAPSEVKQPVHIPSAGKGNSANLSPLLSTAHTDENIEQMIKAVKENIVDFLPPDTTSPPTPLVAGEGLGGLDQIQTLPLTEAQKELWVMAQMGENVSRAYHHSTTIHLRGSFNLAAARKAIQAIVDRHEALRTNFSREGDYQLIHSSLKIDIPCTDLSKLEHRERELKLADILTIEAQQIFNLEKDILFRTQIVKLEEQHHLLILTVHHIIADGWSLGVLQQELAAIYTAECQGIVHQLPQPMQLSEYVRWEEKQQESPEMAKAETYWLQQFSGFVPVLELPYDRPRPSINRYIGTRQSIKFNPSLYGEIKNFSIKHKTTLFTTLLAGFMALLHRLTGQEDIVVGIPTAGQISVEGEYLVGHYVNLLPIRSQVDANPQFTEYLNSIKQVLSDAYEHQIYPFINLVKKLNLSRDTSRNPLVTVLFNLDRTISSSASFSKEIEFVRNPTCSTISDIFLNLHQKDGELVVECEYNTDLFDSQTIERWMGHWQTLLEGIINHPERAIFDLPLLNVTERRQMLIEWNNTQINYPKDRCIHQLFEERVASSPDRIACIFEGQHLTYRELNAKANQLARYLQNLGVTSEVLVGICMDRSLDAIVAILGILKAGGAYVPLDPAYPQERLNFMVADAKLSLAIGHSSLVKNFEKISVICLDTDWEIIQRESVENPVNTSTPDNLAYVIYTSGSTGKPKGVLGLHRGAVNRFNWMWQTYPFAAEEVCCQKTSLNFVDSVWEIFGSLLQGIPTVIVSDRVLKDPHQFGETIASNNVTRIVLVPSLLHVLLDTFEDLQKRLPKLNFWVTSGEALSVDLLHKFRQILPDRTLLNLYGASEVSADVTCYEISPQDVDLRVSIGRPIANTQIYVLDRYLQPVPIGVPGELYVSGAGLARGYLDRPELTAEKFIFIPSFIDDKQSMKLYKTGDLVCYLPNGNLKFIGRIDNQVKLRGFRIELAEIEAVLMQYSGVKQAVVSIEEDEENNKQLFAYIVPDREITANELLFFLKQKLPNYMLPSAFVMLESLPLLPNGKVNLQALPKPEKTRSQLAEAYQAPRTELEQTIANIWQEILQVQEVGIYDNFFDIGGDSLLLVRVHNQLQKILQRNFSLMGMFQYPTINYLAEYLSQNQSDRSSFTNELQPSEIQANSIERRRRVRQEHRAAARQRREQF